MDIAGILSLIGGIALFLFGMSVMGDSLKKVAGSKMEVILYKLSGNTIKGVALGTGVTAVVQSSSAVSVMVVGQQSERGQVQCGIHSKHRSSYRNSRPDRYYSLDVCQKDIP